MQLNEQPSSLLFIKGVAYVYRGAYDGERPNCGAYVLVRYSNGYRVERVTPEMVRRVERDVELREVRA